MSLPLSKEQELWINQQAEKNGVKVAFNILTKSKTVNPCIAVFGAGPAGQICKRCSHLYRRRLANTYLKCDLRHETGGPGTDHKANWPACSRFETSNLKS